MPLKLVSPREGRSPYFRIRGTHHRTTVDRSTKTTERRIAQKILRALEDEIERGAYARPSDPIFSDAVIEYQQAGHDKRFLTRLVEHFKDTPLVRIDQKAIDRAAVLLYPNATPATRNRQVYSPVIAILHHAGIKDQFKRPKGHEGKKRTSFLSVEQAQALFNAAIALDAEFAVFIAFLCYTGCRLSEGCGLLASDVHLSEGWAFVRDGKTGDRTVYLPPALVAAMASLPLGERDKAFRFNKNGYVYKLFREARERAGIRKSERVAFHLFRHTYGQWMRKAGADLVGTGAWKSEKAASIYKHLEVTEEAMKADHLPQIGVTK